MLLRRVSTLFVCLLNLMLATTAAFADGKVPRPSPDFAINMNNGSQLHISQYHGKVVVLAFILTYCAHCQFTSQILAGLQKEYAPQGFQVVAAATEDMAAMAVPDFIRRFQPGFPVGFAPRNTVENYLEHPVMFKMMMPQVVVIDRKGVIRAQLAGDDKFFNNADQEKNFRELLVPILKEGAAREGHKRSVAKKKA